MIGYGCLPWHGACILGALYLACMGPRNSNLVQSIANPFHFMPIPLMNALHEALSEPERTNDVVEFILSSKFRFDVPSAKLHDHYFGPG